MISQNDDYDEKYKNTVDNEILLERQRLVFNPAEDTKPSGLGVVRFIASCEGGAKDILNKAKDILITMNSYYGKAWPNLDEWRAILPEDFVNKFEREKTWQEIQDIKRTYEENVQKGSRGNLRGNDRWTLSAWLEWFEDDSRTWFWWGDALLDDPRLTDKYFIIAVSILDWPFPWGTLKVLFQNCGAINLEAEGYSSFDVASTANLCDS